MTSLRLSLSLLVLLSVQLIAWQWSLSYEHFLTLSGYLAINFMSLTMILAIRSRWLELPLNGLDKLYRLHKWTGILAVIFALSHWLIEMADDVFKAFFGKDRSLREADFSGLLDSLQDMSEDFGEPGLYLLVGLVVMTLIKWVPYRFWRYVHRAMPLIYLALASHALLLAPSSWWQQPVGWLMAGLISGGILASVLSLTGAIGKTRRWKGWVHAIHQTSQQTTEVICAMGKNWPGHKAGQFTLVTFDRMEGAHPFTLASADAHDGYVGFQIKALGDYTRTLSDRLHVGRPVTLEGPYGCFNPEKGRTQAQQVWIAGGVGITPFLAALEARLINADKAYADVTLHYATPSAVNDANVQRLKTCVEQLPNVSLQIYESDLGQRLTVDHLTISQSKVDVWFCGPQGLAKALRKDLTSKPISLRFHQELFEFR